MDEDFKKNRDSSDDDFSFDEQSSARGRDSKSEDPFYEPESRSDSDYREFSDDNRSGFSSSHEREDNPFTRENDYSNDQRYGDNSDDGKKKILSVATILGILFLAGLGILGISNFADKGGFDKLTKSIKPSAKTDKTEKKKQDKKEQAKEQTGEELGKKEDDDMFSFADSGIRSGDKSDKKEASDLTSGETKFNIGDLEEGKDFCFVDRPRKYIVEQLSEIERDILSLTMGIDETQPASRSKDTIEQWKGTAKNLTERLEELRKASDKYIEEDPAFKWQINDKYCLVKDAPKHIYLWFKELKEKLSYVQDDLGYAGETKAITNKTSESDKKEVVSTKKSGKKVYKKSPRRVKAKVTRRIDSRELSSNRTSPTCAAWFEENKEILLQNELKAELAKAKAEKSQAAIAQLEDRIAELENSLDKAIKRCEANSAGRVISHGQVQQTAERMPVETDACTHGYYLASDGYCYEDLRSKCPAGLALGEDGMCHSEDELI